MDRLAVREGITRTALRQWALGAEVERTAERDASVRDVHHRPLLGLQLSTAA
jgi:hypothetical protein